MTNQKNYITSLVIAALLGSLFAFHFAVSYKILSKTTYIRGGDFVFWIAEGKAVKNIILPQAPFRERAKKLYLFFVTLKGQYHPKLFTLVNGICRALIKDRKNENLEILLATSVFLLILLIAMYKIGALLYDRKTGLFLAFFISFIPIIFSQARIQMLDLPLTAMCTLSLYLLLRTRYFTSLPYSILAGIVWGLAQLTKELFLVFFLPALIYYAILSVKKGKEASPKRVWVNIILSLVTFSTVAGMVYLQKQNNIMWKVYMRNTTYYSSNAYCLLYILAFPFAYFHPFLFAVLFPFFIVYFIKAGAGKRTLFYAFIIPLIVFSLSPDKYARFLTPLVPVFVLICTEGIRASLKGRTKTMFLSGLLILSAAQFIAINSGSPFYFWYYGKLLPKFKLGAYGINSVPFAFRRDEEYFKLLPMLSRLFEANNKKINLTLTFHDDKLKHILGQIAEQKKADIYIFCPIFEPTGISVASKTLDFDKGIRDSQYVIDNNELRSGKAICFRKEIKQAFLKDKELFALVLEFNLEKKGIIAVYKNRNY